MQKAYLRFASFHNDRLVFVTDDDIWTATIDVESPETPVRARRLTTSAGWVDGTSISPDGQTICYSSNDSSEFDIYQLPIDGGVSERLTYFGDAKVVGFWDSKHVIVRSSSHQINRFQETLKKVEVASGQFENLDYGPATDFSKKGEFLVLGRFTKELGRWKGYRGGLAGNLWFRSNLKSGFKKLMAQLDSNLSCPNVVGKRIYFLSDHEGTGNIYSCDLRGRNLKKHTDFEGLYARQLVANSSLEEDYLLFHRGGELFFLDLDTDEIVPLAVSVDSGWNQSQPRFVPAVSCLQDFDVSENGRKIAAVFRGQLHMITPWIGAPFQVHLSGVERIRNSSFGKDDHLFITAVNARGEDIVVHYNAESRENLGTVLEKDIGKISYLSPSPDGKYIALSTERYCLYLLEIKTSKLKKIDIGNTESIENFDWSPDSRWLVYSVNFSFMRSEIKIFSVSTGKTQRLIEPLISDTQPVFDPSGRYVYFLGIRELIPRMDESHFHVGYPDAIKPYCIRLRKQDTSPFDKPYLFEDDNDGDAESEEASDKQKSSKSSTDHPLKKQKKKKGSKHSKEKKEASKKSEEKEEDVNPVEIDFDEINQRIEPFPVDVGGYDGLACAEDRVFWIRDGGLPAEQENGNNGDASLQAFLFKEGEVETIQDGAGAYAISANGEYLVFEESKELRLVPSDAKPTEGNGYNRKDGWIDLSQIRIRIDPRFEWMQMYKEAWVLQREHFWHEKMEGWLEAFKRYLPLLPLIHTRHEFSDLIWEMQGDLKTSHCYEYSGDFPKKGNFNLVGRLGADFRFLPRKKCLQVESIYFGDCWKSRSHSPLISKHAELRIGDLIFEVDGKKLASEKDIYCLMEHKVDTPVDLKIQRRGSSEFEHVIVKPIADERPLRYRAWIEQNRSAVHTKSKGRLGYIHVPDMGMEGFAEFTRQFLQEADHDGLVIDLRYNAGGFVSELILPLLSQNTLGYFKGRYDSQASNYPAFTVPGPKVLLLNEFTGSDGDIFCHAFKSAGLGKLVGKRSWGGVIGIMPKVGLIDGTITTQPEYSTWFEGIGYGLENYGTDPDIEMEISPDDWSQKHDPQLEKAIAIALKQTSKLKPPKLFGQLAKPSSHPPRLPKK